MINYKILLQSKLFQGISREELTQALQCLGANSNFYEKGQTIYQTGDKIKYIGLLLSGNLHILNYDLWGNYHIINNIEAGQLFAESYACQDDALSLVNVSAIEKSEVLFINVNKILKLCPSCCAHHQTLIKNLLHILAFKNLDLIKKLEHITPKNIRERILAYLHFEAKKQNNYNFNIPFNRQQLADYLLVDRSALSNELSKMQKNHLIEYQKNHFVLKK